MASPSSPSKPSAQENVYTASSVFKDWFTVSEKKNNTRIYGAKYEANSPTNWPSIKLFEPTVRNKDTLVGK